MADTELEVLKRNFKLAVKQEPAAYMTKTVLSCNGDNIAGEFFIDVYVTEYFVKKLHKNKGMINNPLFYKALKNAKYGYDIKNSTSQGEKDGIFDVTEAHTPRNEMTKKLFDDFYSKDRGQEILAKYFSEPAELSGVRIVCHGLRLLGFISNEYKSGVYHQKLVLVDLSINKPCP